MERRGARSRPRTGTPAGMAGRPPRCRSGDGTGRRTQPNCAAPHPGRVMVPIIQHVISSNACGIDSRTGTGRSVTSPASRMRGSRPRNRLIVAVPAAASKLIAAPSGKAYSHPVAHRMTWRSPWRDAAAWCLLSSLDLCCRGGDRRGRQHWHLGLLLLKSWTSSRVGTAERLLAKMKTALPLQPVRLRSSTRRQRCRLSHQGRS